MNESGLSIKISRIELREQFERAINLRRQLRQALSVLSNLFDRIEVLCLVHSLSRTSQTSDSCVNVEYRVASLNVERDQLSQISSELWKSFPGFSLRFVPVHLDPSGIDISSIALWWLPSSKRLQVILHFLKVAIQTGRKNSAQNITSRLLAQLPSLLLAVADPISRSNSCKCSDCLHPSRHVVHMEPVAKPSKFTHTNLPPTVRAELTSPLHRWAACA